MDPKQLPLRDLHLPDPVSWWPLAPGWWLVIAVLLLGIGWLIWRVWRQWRFNAPRRYALQAVTAIEKDYLVHRDPVRLSKELSQLLRRGMLAYASRTEVAGLTGEAWLRWLDEDLPVPYFHTEGGKSLLQLPYRNPDDKFDDVDVNAMLAAVRMRLSVPVGGSH